jgi:hypothetical protein
MKKFAKTALSAALVIIFTQFPLGLGALAYDHDHYDYDRGDRGYDRGDHGHYSGAPGPIAGAGLPVIAVGYGVYWLVRRRKAQ